MAIHFYGVRNRNNARNVEGGESGEGSSRDAPQTPEGRSANPYRLRTQRPSTNQAIINLAGAVGCGLGLSAAATSKRKLQDPQDRTAKRLNQRTTRASIARTALQRTQPEEGLLNHHQALQLKPAQYCDPPEQTGIDTFNPPSHGMNPDIWVKLMSVLGSTDTNLFLGFDTNHRFGR